MTIRSDQEEEEKKIRNEPLFIQMENIKKEKQRRKKTHIGEKTMVIENQNKRL